MLAQRRGGGKTLGGVKIWRDNLSPMWQHFLNFIEHSWQSFRSSLGTTSLGFIAPLAVSILSIAITLFIVLRKQGKEAMLKRWKEDAAIALRVTLIVALGVYGPIFLYEGLIKTVYEDHQSLLQANKKLSSINADLRSKLEKRRHGLDTTDPVFSNTIYLLQAFQIYRHALNGAPCVIRVTAPPKSLPMASMVAQFSNSVSGCSTFGPEDFELNPDLEKEAMDGMVPDAIVFHAARGDKAADQLFNNLGNQIRLKRSYHIPSQRNYQSPMQGKERFLWLQFGTKTQWNSEVNNR